MGTVGADNSNFKLCDQLPSYVSKENKKEDLMASIQKTFGTKYKLLEYECSNKYNVKKDPANKLTFNTCGYNKIKMKDPTAMTDCDDEDKDGYNKCCYIKATF